MSLPANFALLAVNPAIRENDGFLFLQTGQSGYIDMFLQAGSGNPVNILKISSGTPIANTLYVNTNGNDSTAQKYTIDYPYKTIAKALENASGNDLVEVYPGSYDLNSNLFKNGVTLFFHKNTSVNFGASGKLHVTGISDTGVFSIYGNGAFIDAGAANDAFQISGGQVVIEFDYFNCSNRNFVIESTSSQTANIVFKTKGDGNNKGKLRFNNFTVKSENVRFENVYLDSTIVKLEGSASKKTVFDNCVLSSTETAFETPRYSITGQFEFNECLFSGLHPRFVALAPSSVRSSTFQGGVTSSGSIYFDSCIWDTKATNIFPNSSLITNIGGNVSFGNCYAKNANSTSNPVYSFIASGAASGSSNFNIFGTFSSFLPTASGTSIRYGIFAHNPYLK